MKNKKIFMAVGAIALVCILAVVGITMQGNDKTPNADANQKAENSTDTNLIVDVELKEESTGNDSELENNIKDFDSTNGVVIYETPEDFSAEAEEQIAMDNSKDEYVEGTEQAPSETPEQETPPAPDFVVEAVNKTMYALQSVNLRQGPSADTAKVGDLTYAQEVTVTGVVHSYKGESCLWYQLSTGEFASGAYLTVNKPQQSTTEDTNTDTGNSSQEESTNTEIPELKWDGGSADDFEYGGEGDASGNDSDFRFN